MPLAVSCGRSSHPERRKSLPPCRLPERFCRSWPDWRTCSLTDSSDLLGPAQNQTAFVLVFATAIAIASIPVISRIMLDLGILETAFARIVIATAVIDDLLLYLVLAVRWAWFRQARRRMDSWRSSVSIRGVAGHRWSTCLATLVVIAATLLAGSLFWRAALRLKNRFLRWDDAAIVHVGLSDARNEWLPALGRQSDVRRFGGRNDCRPRVAAPTVGDADDRSNGLSRTIFVPLYFALVACGSI